MDFDLSDTRNLIFERRQDRAKIFISSKMKGGSLLEERAAAIAAAEEFPLTDPWAWEINADAGPYCSERECVAQAGTSDGLVLIVNDEITPITMKEFEAAQRAGAPVFLMLKVGADRGAELDQFIERVRDKATTASFSTPAELRTRVTSALRTFFLRAVRSGISQARVRARPDDRPDFRGMQVMFGDDIWITIADLVEQSRERVQAGEVTEVIETLWEIASGAQEIGLSWVSLGLLDAIEEIVPADVIDDRWRGWLANQRGLGLSQTGARQAARQEFERMRLLGRALDDTDLESTALQNLGVQDLLDGDHPAARSNIERSLKLKQELEDWRGALQVLSNFVNVLVDEDKLDVADQLLDDLEQVLRRVCDPGLRSSLHGQRGTVAIARRDLQAAQAEFRLALEAARRDGSVPRIITSMQNLGTVAHDLGDSARGSRWYAKALALAEEIDDISQRRIQRQSLGRMLVELGEYDQAAESFLRAAEEAKQLGDETEAAIAVGDAGASLFEAGDPGRGRQLTEQALAMAGGTGHWRAHQLTNLAKELGALGEPELAIQRLLEAANLADDSARADALRAAGETAIRTPVTASQAAEIFRQELAVRRGHEPSERWGWRAAEIGATLSHTSQTSDAVEFFGIALRVFARRKDRREAFFIRNDRALALAELHDLPAAARDMRAALRLAESMRDDALRQQAHMNLGELRRRKGQYDAASDELERSLSIARRLEDLESQSQTLSLVALNAEDRGDAAAALTSLREAEDIARGLGDKRLQAQATKARAHMEYDARRFARARSLYSRTVRLLGEEQSIQMAESLGGALMSGAHRGQLDESLLDRLVETSERIGWDVEFLTHLVYSVPILAEKGSDADVARLAAVMLLVALRVVMTRGMADPDQVAPAVDTSLAATWWIDKDDSRRELLANALVDLAGEEAADLLMANIDAALGVIAEKRADGSGQSGSVT